MFPKLVYGAVQFGEQESAIADQVPIICSLKQVIVRATIHPQVLPQRVAIDDRKNSAARSYNHVFMQTIAELGSSGGTNLDDAL